MCSLAHGLFVYCKSDACRRGSYINDKKMDRVFKGQLLAYLSCDGVLASIAEANAGLEAGFIAAAEKALKELKSPTEADGGVRKASVLFDKITKLVSFLLANYPKVRAPPHAVPRLNDIASLMTAPRGKLLIRD